MKSTLLALAAASVFVVTSGVAASVVTVNLTNPKNTVYADIVINGKDMAAYGPAEKISPNSNTTVEFTNQDVADALSHNFFSLDHQNTLKFYQCDSSSCSASKGTYVGQAQFVLTGTANAYHASPNDFTIHLS